MQRKISNISSDYDVVFNDREHDNDYSECVYRK